MVTPTRHSVAPDIPAWRRIQTLSHYLRAIYHDTYWPAHQDATGAGGRYEMPDGTSLDPTYAADAAACRAVNDALAGLIATLLPNAVLLERVDAASSVIDSVWLYQPSDGEDLEVTIEWDYRCSFGDPDGLTVTARKAASQ